LFPEVALKVWRRASSLTRERERERERERAANFPHVLRWDEVSVEWTETK
jgi:hypothetical protein